MKILMVVCFLVPFIYFGYLMTKLDEFLVSNAMSIGEIAVAYSAIVLGGGELAEKVAELLEVKGIKVIKLTEPFQLVKDQNLYYLFALSENDADNIAFCKLGVKLYGIRNIIGICNEKRNEDMFINEGIDYMINDKVSADKLLQHLQLSSEVRT